MELFEPVEGLDYLTFTPDALGVLNRVIIADTDNEDLRRFILHAILAGSMYDKDVLMVMMGVIANAINEGVEPTVELLHNQYDMDTGPDRVERALADNLL